MSSIDGSQTRAGMRDGRRTCRARLADLGQRLDRRVHDLYLVADAEYPPEHDWDRDACALHNDLVENDRACAELLEQIAVERIVLADLNRAEAA